MCFYLSATNQIFIRGETCMTGWPFPRFHELSQCASIYNFFGLNPLKCKSEEWVDEVHFKQIIEKIHGCVTRMCGAMVQYIMAKHKRRIQLAQTRVSIVRLIGLNFKTSQSYCETRYKKDDTKHGESYHLWLHTTSMNNTK